MPILLHDISYRKYSLKHLYYGHVFYVWCYKDILLHSVKKDVPYKGMVQKLGHLDRGFNRE